MRFFLKAWVAIMVALISAISLGLSTFNFLSKAPWSLVGLISFIIFAIIIIAGIIDRDRDLTPPLVSSGIRVRPTISILRGSQVIQ